MLDPSAHDVVWVLPAAQFDRRHYACENAIRPFTVGRKDWLVHDTVAGANAAANLYSLFETLKANSVEPYGYLVALFKALSLAYSVDDYETLLPSRLATSSAD